MIDSFINVSLIKIDVEGMVIEALKGADKIISKFWPIICWEQNPLDYNANYIETESLDWLRTKDYKIFSLAGKKPRNLFVRRLKKLKQML